MWPKPFQISTIRDRTIEAWVTQSYQIFAEHLFDRISRWYKWYTTYDPFSKVSCTVLHTGEKMNQFKTRNKERHYKMISHCVIYRTLISSFSSIIILIMTSLQQRGSRVYGFKAKLKMKTKEFHEPCLKPQFLSVY